MNAECIILLFACNVQCVHCVTVEFFLTSGVIHVYTCTSRGNRGNTDLLYSNYDVHVHVHVCQHCFLHVHVPMYNVHVHVYTMYMLLYMYM